MSTPDPRFGIAIPALGDLANITGVRDALLATLALIASVSGGTYAARPAFGTFGRFYRQTDVGGSNVAGTITFDTGAAWVAVNPIDAAAATASMRTLGTTATSAAAGNDPRLLAGETGVKAPVRAVHTSNVVDLNNPGTMTYGGIVCVAGDRILLAGQTSTAQNGIYIVGASGAAPLVRSADMAAGSIVAGGLTVTVSESSVGVNVDSLWIVTTNDTSLVVGTDAQVWAWMTSPTGGVSAAAANSWTGVQTFAAAPVQAVQALTASGTVTTAGGKLVTFVGAAGQTITLPAATVGREVEVFNIDTTDTVIVDGNGAETIEGMASIVLPAGAQLSLACVVAGAWKVMGPLPLHCRVYLNANLAVASGGAGTNIAWDAEGEDLQGMHVAAASAITIPMAGLWAMQYTAQWAADPGANAGTFIDVGGVKYARDFSVVTTTRRFKGSDIVRMAAGTVVNFQVIQSTGASLNLQGGGAVDGWTCMALTRVGA